MNPADPKFLVSVDESTTLGQLQIVLACLDCKLHHAEFVAGRYHVSVTSRGEAADASESTLGKAIGSAIGRLRFKLAAALVRDIAIEAGRT